MIFRRFFLSCILSLLFFSGGQLFAQIRPAGSDLSFLEIVSSGTDVLALAEPDTLGTRIFRSTDGGDTYTQIYEAQENDSLFALGVNGTEVMAVGTGGIILKADMAVDPATWVSMSVEGFIGDLRDVVFANGFWMVTGEKTYVINDGGTNWVNFDENPFDPQFSAIYVGMGVGAESGSQIWMTAGGIGIPRIRRLVYTPPPTNTVVVSTISAPFLAGGIRSLAVDAANNVLAVGESGTVLLSTDMGQTFNIISQVDVSQNLNAVISTAANQWVIGGDERLLLNLDTSGGTPVSTTLLEPVDPVTGNTTLALTEQNGSVIMAGTASVDAPSISGDPSDFTNPAGPVEITLSGPGGTSIYYTTDDSSPDASDTLYTAPFSLISSGTVRAVAELDGVYSVEASQIVTASSQLILSIAVNGMNIEISSDTSVVGTDLQLQLSTDLTDPMGWSDVGAVEAGTGASILWSVPIPALPSFWRVVVTPQ